jgi:hypothetical protein
MIPAGRLIGFALIAAALAALSLWITRESLRPRESPQEIGLRWLKEEYLLDAAAFGRIRALHDEYFTQCTKMCRQIAAAARPLLWRARHRSREYGDVGVQLSLEQALCGDCEKAAVQHLQQVAVLMPPAEGKRFLDDVLPALQQQRREHERLVSSSLRR